MEQFTIAEQNLQQLLLDGSTERALVALASSSKVLFEEYLPTGFEHSKFLLSKVVQAVERVNWTLETIDEIFIGSGPGSHTGIRVTEALAQGIAFAKNCPIHRLPSLQAIPLPHAHAVVLADAKGAGVYRYESGKKIDRLSIEEITRELEGRGFLTVVTPHFSTLSKRLAHLPHIHWEEGWPTARGLLRLTHQYGE